MAAYESFVQYVEPSVKGASEPLMVRAIRDACIDFCSQTLLFQQTLEPVLSIAGIGDYDIYTPTDTLVARVQQAWYDNRKIEDIVQDDVTTTVSLTAQYGTTVEPGTPKRIIYTGVSTFLLDPIPDTSGKNIVLMAALKPSRTSTTVFDQLFEDYAEQIGHGAVARLMQIKNSVFYDAVQAAVEAKLFRNAIADATARANMGALGTKTLRVKPVRI